MKIKIGNPVFLIIHCFKYTLGKNKLSFYIMLILLSPYT